MTRLTGLLAATGLLKLEYILTNTLLHLITKPTLGCVLTEPMVLTLDLVFDLIVDARLLWFLADLNLIIS